MTRFIKWLLLSFAFLLNPLFARVAQANTITAATCSLAVVQAAISSAVAGDIVLVPAGTCSWSGGISVSGIQLIGAGKSASGTVITAGTVTMTKHTTQHTRVSGFRFTGTDQHISVGGSATNKAFIIDNNYFFSNGGNFTAPAMPNGGVIHHNDFELSPPSGADTWAIQPSEDWSQAPTWGNLDTTGERNIYIEDNTFLNVVETGPDGDAGGRFVIRHNTYTDSSIVFHGGGAGGSGNDTSQYGIRQFEVYNNTFHRVSNSFAVNKWVWARGATGVIANNVMDKADSPDGSSFTGKTEVKLGVSCPSPYPLQYQVGQSNTTPENPPSHPLLIFGNTGAGSTDVNFITLSPNGGGGSCATPGNYIQSGRDYMLSNTWGWIPYTYPHPLAQSLGSNVAAPNNLTAVVH